MDTRSLKVTFGTLLALVFLNCPLVHSQENFLELVGHRIVGYQGDPRAEYSEEKVQFKNKIQRVLISKFSPSEVQIVTDKESVGPRSQFIIFNYYENYAPTYVEEKDSALNPFEEESSRLSPLELRSRREALRLIQFLRKTKRAYDLYFDFSFPNPEQAENYRNLLLERLFVGDQITGEILTADEFLFRFSQLSDSI